ARQVFSHVDIVSEGKASIDAKTPEGDGDVPVSRGSVVVDRMVHPSQGVAMDEAPNLRDRRIEYRVGLAERTRHLFEVEALFPIAGTDPVDLKLPLWTPGS